MYAARLLKLGFHKRERLHSIDDAIIRELSMPPFHVARLRKGLRQFVQSDRVDERDSTGNVVEAFLAQHGLERYVSVLLSSGFDEMDTLLEVHDDDLKDLGFPRGHALKLKRHLREYETVSYMQRMGLPVEVQPGMAMCEDALPPLPSSRSEHLCLQASSTMQGDVQQSWTIIEQVGTAEVGEHLYKRFFKLAPEAAGCFPIHVRRKYREWTGDESEEEGDLRRNSAALRKLFGRVLSAIGLIVAGLQDTGKLVPLLLSLGGRHVGYGVSEAFWPALGQALQDTLAEVLGEVYTPEVQHTWSVVYGFASSIMLAGLREAREAAATAATSSATALRERSLEECPSGQSEISRTSTRSFATSAFHPSETGHAPEMKMGRRRGSATESTVSSLHAADDEAA